MMAASRSSGIGSDLKTRQLLRFLTRSDITYNDQQYYLGIKEPWDVSQALTWGTVLKADLLDVSDVVVFQGGEVKCEDGCKVKGKLAVGEKVTVAQKGKTTTIRKAVSGC